MVVKNQNGREVEISVYGKYDDDIEIDEAYYLDGDDEVSDEDIEYIMDTYADAIYNQWFEQKIDKAYSYYERD